MPKSAQISGFDIAARNYKDLTNEVVNLGGGDDEMNRIHNDRNLRRQIAELIVPQSIPAHGGKVIGQLRLSLVDHTASVGDLAAAGRYSFVSPHITDANFSHLRKGRERDVMLDLIQFDRVMITGELDRVLPTFGEPSDMDDQLAIGIEHPDEQRKRIIVCFGASWVNPCDRYVGRLNGGAYERYCGLFSTHPQDTWDSDCVFPVRARK